ncbi:hypothetical protein BgiBS90_012232 [Biomphalaria glabrata]|nr:hypothetical protein BgiBS90_012232 [Biomphalaria glabrata]
MSTEAKSLERFQKRSSPKSDVDAVLFHSKLNCDTSMTSFCFSSRSQKQSRYSLLAVGHWIIGEHFCVVLIRLRRLLRVDQIEEIVAC